MFFVPSLVTKGKVRVVLSESLDTGVKGRVVVLCKLSDLLLLVMTETDDLGDLDAHSVAVTEEDRLIPVEAEVENRSVNVAVSVDVLLAVNDHVFDAEADADSVS